MTVAGLSTNRHCHPSAACLTASGKQFVFRYHSRTTTQPQKRISPREAAELARSGLEIATVYQDNARLPGNFSEERGLLDGASAHEAAGLIGQPPGSAIYFAVDADFSAQQIQSFVIAYFRGVRQGLDQAGGGTSPYKVGVYGSGLVCQLVRDSFALADYAWLALATAWRGSAGYSNWDVRQLAPTGPLCGLDTHWEACEGRGNFGQFRPVGFDVTAEAGERRWVKATQLNLRFAPSIASQPPITQLPEGQEVRVLGDAAPPWIRVRAKMAGTDVIGYVHGNYLSSQDPGFVLLNVPAAGSIPAVHYRTADSASRRGSAAKRAQPLGEPSQPTRTRAAPPAQRVTELDTIVQWLGVETSARYQPDDVTFCNVYAADFCYLAGAYLPRTWWTETALMAIATGQRPPVVYGQTIREMRADDLFAWLSQFGPAFGWRRVFDATALQESANGGGLGVIVADRLEAGRPGHITLVVPETAQRRALSDADGNVLLPLQSQAGARNTAYSTLSRDWWNDQQFADEDGFFVHD